MTNTYTASSQSFSLINRCEEQFLNRFDRNLAEKLCTKSCNSVILLALGDIDLYTDKKEIAAKHDSVYGNQVPLFCLFFLKHNPEFAALFLPSMHDIL